MANVEEHLKFVKHMSEEIKHICDEVVDHECSWPSFKQLIFEKIEYEEKMFNTLKKIDRPILKGKQLDNFCFINRLFKWLKT